LRVKAARLSAPDPSDLLARRGYHHGNLREALVEGARSLVAERGPHGFTLAEAARLAGVSASAPYRHFKDRDALMAELRRRGFAAFGARMGKAAAEGGLTAMGPAYLAFARDEPGYYGAIFAWRDPSPEPGEGPFATLVAALAPGLPPGADGAAARLLALQVWALSHGLAGLERAGMPTGADALTPEQMLADAVGKLLRGSRGGA
jgi:AcrR family transcriptional regulator